jgi:hypothetical protein
MAGPYINEETPPGIELYATPRNAVTGTLRSDVSVQEVADALTEAGIAPSTVHFLAGGRKALLSSGSWGTGLRAPSIRAWRKPANRSSPVPRWWASSR